MTMGSRLWPADFQIEATTGEIRDLSNNMDTTCPYLIVDTNKIMCHYTFRPYVERMDECTHTKDHKECIHYKRLKDLMEKVNQLKEESASCNGWKLSICDKCADKNCGNSNFTGV
mgnify:CR=1 FL=1